MFEAMLHRAQKRQHELEDIQQMMYDQFKKTGTEPKYNIVDALADTNNDIVWIIQYLKVNKDRL